MDTVEISETERRARDAVRAQYQRIGETQRQCQAAMVAIAEIMDWGPEQLNRIIGASFFSVPPTSPAPPSPPAPATEEAQA